jgi:raffinose/stachyose/melibiose transport system permease protein
MKTRKIARSIAANTVACIVSLILIIPLLLILVNSFKTSLAASDMTLALPSEWKFDNFKVVIEKGKLDTAFLNSLIYSAGSVAVCVLFAAMASFVLSRRRSHSSKVLYLFFVLGITMPINFVSLMKVMQVLHLYNTRGGIVLLYAALQMPFAIFLMYGFISKIPREIDEAAVIDGCPPLQLFFQVILPLLKPVVITVMVLTFLNTWNEFVLPLYFTGSTDKWPMTLAVYNFFGIYFKDWNLICADILLTSLPVIAVYFLGQKHIVSGMTSGAVKG